MRNKAQSGATKIHVRLTEGHFQNLRRLISWPLLLAFFGMVWVQVDGLPWLLFDFEQRRLILFGSHFAWQDFHIMTALMIAGAALLFTLAMAWGRVWCGFACPQSIWTWLFLRIEHWTEGRAAQRARSEGQPLQGSRLFRRVSKHLLWLLLAAVTGLTFTGYFIPIREMLPQLISMQATPALLIWLLCMTLLTYLNAGLVREQICLHACPYSRFQGVMMDDATRKVSYDRFRGEPRRSSEHPNPAADACIDCTLCVQVCPTGIDIRNGMQAACIDCGACIDACDQVMHKTGQPTGLIRFASELQLQGEADHFWRPRLMGYLLICLVAVSAASYGFYGKKELTAEIRRDRGELFRVLSDGRLCNFYHIKVESFNPAQQQVAVVLLEPSELSLYGPQQLQLDNRGDWVAYRICGEDSAAAPRSLLVQFTTDSSVLIKRTTFISRLSSPSA
ncbi:cytochrome c oxidase accessory protein CcoG [Marinospirillum alkaliphilum]|uniref:Cytochrome c oxidase accessory protein FixG n=1 Tax=Marinospirillum alkaliphilum DSM 21637 TaxID=1122209 RepID=A0A1K1X6A4_9GAMM|nr:cytochrome c oxidase accessory protein CcoG [Marinospirillum alkaliphilum]SFX45178.1 cytochrome c oxidase accessory protein FixG [Marinospirillum alkaliphilum DSM 21637]